VIINLNGAKLSKIDTADDFLRRVEELCAVGAGIELLDLSHVADGMPPDLCAASHPNNLVAGEALPNANNSCVISTHTGVYNPGIVCNSALVMYKQHNQGNVALTIEAERSALSSAFGDAAHDNIASLAMTGSDPAPAALENNNSPRPF
jgi:hypothetical protein